MGVLRAQTPVLQALNYVDLQLAKAPFNGPVRERLEEDVEGAVTKLLIAALRELLSVLLCSIDQAANAVGDVVALEGCCKLLGHLAENYDVAHALVAELNGAEVLSRALRAHPDNWGVANEALWAQAQISGASAVASVLCDPGLASMSVPVRAAIRVLSHLPQCKYADLESALKWGDRFQMAQVVVAAMARHPEDVQMRGYSCSALGSLLVSWAPDVVHSETAKVLPVIFDAMRADLDSEDMQVHSSYAIASIIQGNAHAAAVLRHEQNSAILAQVLERYGEKSRVRQNLLKTVMAVEGIRGLLSAMSRFDNQGMHSDILWTIGHCDSDDGVEEVIITDAIACVAAVVQRWGAELKPHAVAAVKKLLLILLSSANSHSPSGGHPPWVNAAQQGLTFLIETLHERTGSSGVRAVAYEGLAEAALQNGWARATLNEAPRCRESLVWWRSSTKLDVPEATEALLLAGVLQNSVEPVLQAMLEYPGWQDLQIAACTALMRLAQADEDDPQNAVKRAAIRVAHCACSALQNQPHAWTSLRVAVAGVLGITLGAVGESSGPEALVVVTQGCEDLLGTLRHLLKRTVPQRVSDARASDISLVLQSITTIAEEGPMARAILSRPDCGAVPLLAEVTRELAMHASSLMLTEALLALGLLGSARLVCEAMGAFGNAYWFQVSGVMALNNLVRLGALSGVGEADLAVISASVQQATDIFKCRENAALHSQATVTLQLIKIAAQ